MPGEENHWKDAYERLWLAREAVIRSIVAGERDLSRAISGFLAFERMHRLSLVDGSDETAWSRNVDYRADPYAKLEADIHGVSCGSPALLARYLSFDYPQLLNDFAASSDGVVEIGAGYGLQLFRMWLAGGRADLRYIAAEPSVAARRSAEVLADLAPGMKIEVTDFDFVHPDFGFLSGLDNPFVFTCFSVMMCPDFGPAFFDELCAKAKTFTLLFIEPFGFQLSVDDEISARQSFLATMSKFNLSFYSVLRDALEKHGLSLELIKRHVFGDAPNDLPSFFVVTRGG